MNLLFKLSLLFNRLLLKSRFKSIGKFSIASGSRIIGGEKILIGENFGAKKGLRIEAFGTGSNPKIIIGSNVDFGEYVHLGAINNITIENNVLFGSRILVIDHNHGIYSKENQSSPMESPLIRELNSPGPIYIKENVWIGDGVIVLPNVVIGKSAVIGANTVVNKNVDDYTIVAGNPMRTLKRYNFDSKTWEKSTG